MANKLGYRNLPLSYDITDRRKAKRQMLIVYWQHRHEALQRQRGKKSPWVRWQALRDRLHKWSGNWLNKLIDRLYGV